VTSSRLLLSPKHWENFHELPSSSLIFSLFKVEGKDRERGGERENRNKEREEGVEESLKNE